MFPKSNIPSERLLVFSALMLHSDNKVRHSKDKKITIENLLKEWSVEKFQSLVQSYKRFTQFSSNAVRTRRNDPRRNCERLRKWFKKGTSKM